MIHKSVFVLLCLLVALVSVGAYQHVLDDATSPTAPTSPSPTQAVKVSPQSEQVNKTVGAIDSFRRNHEELMGAQYWLNKLEQRLLAEKERIKDTVKTKRDTYLNWKKKTRELKVQYEAEQTRHERNKALLETSNVRFKEAEDSLKAAQQMLAQLKGLYLKQLNITKCARDEYLETLKRLKINELKAEMELIVIMKTKFEWLEQLIAKWVRIKTIHIHHHHYSNGTVTESTDPLQEGQCLCPVQYRPVCGVDGITYSSECVAQCARAQVAYSGRCECKPDLKPPTNSTTTPTPKVEEKPTVPATQAPIVSTKN